MSDTLTSIKIFHVSKAAAPDDYHHHQLCYYLLILMKMSMTREDAPRVEKKSLSSIERKKITVISDGAMVITVVIHKDLFHLSVVQVV